ncbi:hypothetical protein EI94DRAFT_1727610, partial [Lactarius quietus]
TTDTPGLGYVGSAYIPSPPPIMVAPTSCTIPPRLPGRDSDLRRPVAILFCRTRLL